MTHLKFLEQESNILNRLVYCCMLQCVAVCCSVLQCAAMCCSVCRIQYLPHTNDNPNCLSTKTQHHTHPGAPPLPSNKLPKKTALRCRTRSRGILRFMRRRLLSIISRRFSSWHFATSTSSHASLHLSSSGDEGGVCSEEGQLPRRGGGGGGGETEEEKMPTGWHLRVGGGGGGGGGGGAGGGTGCCEDFRRLGMEGVRMGVGGGCSVLQCVVLCCSVLQRG